MKKYVVKDVTNGVYMRRVNGHKRDVDALWKATMFDRRCDATKSGQSWIGHNAKTVEIEVRLKESNDE